MLAWPGSERGRKFVSVARSQYRAEILPLCPACAQYLVKRKGLDFSACGLVDARGAKRQRSALPAPNEPDQAPPPACPVSLAMMDEYDAFARSFQCSVHAHSDAGELDLGARAALTFRPSQVACTSAVTLACHLQMPSQRCSSRAGPA
jgi:hypothetical protein